MKLLKSKLDEMQEKKITKAESIGLYVAVFGLMAVMLIQCIMGMEPSHFIGEFIVLEVVCVYIMVSYLKNGVWDRFFNPGWKNYLISSLIAGGVVGLFSCTVAVLYGPIFSIFKDSLLFFGITFTVCFLGNLLLGKIYKNRRKKLDSGVLDKDLAQAVGITSHTLKAIQQGQYNPSIKLCREICRATGKTLEELFWEEDEDETVCI